MLRSLGLLALLLISTSAIAEVKEFKLTIREHRFIPAEVIIPANTKVKLVIVNEDSTPEEFESHQLNREKVVTGHGTIVVFVGPLKPGRYPFFGDFNAKTAQGAVIVK